MTRAQASGQGDVQTNTDPTKGVACFPPLGCGSDWNVCSTVDDLSATPMGQLHDADAVRAACEEITALAKGGESYSQPPAGGWQPSSLGWLKGTGNVGCGWGSTYWSISPDATPAGDMDPSDLGRLELNDQDYDDVACCIAAMSYENSDIKTGGAAVRFDVHQVDGAGVCRLDRELMLRGNLDQSSGKALVSTNACGDDTEHFFFRPAAGAAGASNLRSAGRCVVANNFTKLVWPRDDPRFADKLAANGAGLKPRGQLPMHGAELPNRESVSSLSPCIRILPLSPPSSVSLSSHILCPTLRIKDPCDGDNCLEAVTWNTINTAEACCQECTSMNELAQVAKMVGGSRSDVGVNATTGVGSTPCVAFQITAGRCQILRQKWFTTRFADAGKGRYPAGDVAMGITEAIQHCTSDGVTDACYREDDSHGHWGTCSSTKVGEAGYNILSDCNYFSSVYYRDPGCVGAACDFTFPPPTNHSNATYHKLVDLGDADAGGFFNATNTEFSFNVSFVDDRGRRGALTGANASDDTAVAGAWDTMASGGAREQADDDANSTCAEFCLYCAMEQTSVDAAGEMTFDDEKDSTANALVCSAPVCRGGAPEDATMSLSVTRSMVETFKTECASRVAGGRRRRRLRRLGDGWHGRRLAENTNRIVGSFQCEGAGKDLCDVSGGNLATVLERASLAKAASPSLAAPSTGGGGNTPGGGGDGNGDGDGDGDGSGDRDGDGDGGGDGNSDGDGDGGVTGGGDDSLKESNSERLRASTVAAGVGVAVALVFVGLY